MIEDDRMSRLDKILSRSGATRAGTEILHAPNSILLEWDRGAAAGNKNNFLFLGAAEITVIFLQV